MAAAEQIKSLIRSFGTGDDTRFYATAMQIAADEARKGHTALATELKKLIDNAKAKAPQQAIFEPIVGQETTILILGTMLGDESIRSREYYGQH